MKPGEYAITGSVRCIGVVDNTTRATWTATIRVMPMLGVAPGRGPIDAECHGSGKAPHVAIQEAVRRACELVRERERERRR